MNVRHVMIAVDNATLTKQGEYNFQMNIPWPSIMHVRQIEAHNDGTDTAIMLLTGSWIPNGGYIGLCHDGTSVAPQTSYYIPDAVQGQQTFNIRQYDNSLWTTDVWVAVLLEFTKADVDEKKKSS